jgi:ABC-2 type transport system permease protein
MTLRMFSAAFVVGFRRSARGRMGVVVTAMFLALVLVAFNAVWRVALAGEEIAGYDHQALLWYLALAEASVMSMSARIVDDIGGDIDNGTYQHELLRPVVPISLRLATTFGAAIARSIVMIAVASVVTFLCVGAPPSAAGLLVGAALVPISVACNVIASHVFGAMAFWVREVRTAWFLYQKLIFFVGGMMFPLQMLPHVVQQVAWGLGLWTVAYVPARFASGHFDWWLLPVQLAWLGIAGAATRLLYRAGERRIVAGAQ